MAATFIPLSTAAETPALDRSQAGPSAAAGGASSSRRSFFSLAESRPVASSASMQPPPSVSVEIKAGPTLELHREGGQVKRVRLQCGCGQVHELECLY